MTSLLTSSAEGGDQSHTVTNILSFYHETRVTGRLTCNQEEKTETTKKTLRA
jgi:hypothetical protein